MHMADALISPTGHLGGGLLLAILLGPYAAFVVISSVLTVQALFFADGGLLALALAGLIGYALKARQAGRGD